MPLLTGWGTYEEQRAACRDRFEHLVNVRMRVEPQDPAQGRSKQPHLVIHRQESHVADAETLARCNIPLALASILDEGAVHRVLVDDPEVATLALDLQMKSRDALG